MKELGDVSWKHFEMFLLKERYEFKRVRGGHAVYKKQGIPRPVIVPRHKKLPDIVIMTNLRTMGISKEYFVAKMKETL
jgi:predicted RNA binding protein YcfA (HicA-like mRNA interferase family)